MPTLPHDVQMLIYMSLRLRFPRFYVGTTLGCVTLAHSPCQAVPVPPPDPPPCPPALPPGPRPYPPGAPRYPIQYPTRYPTRYPTCRVAMRRGPPPVVANLCLLIAPGEGRPGLAMHTTSPSRRAPTHTCRESAANSKVSPQTCNA